MNYRAMNRQILAIASVTFRELIRERILWSSVMFAFFVLAVLFAVAQLSVFEPHRIALDFGAGAISLAGGMMAIVVGGTFINREVKERTLYLVLSKSIWRWQFVVGKLLGLVGILTVNISIMYFTVLVVFLVSGGTFHQNYIWNILLQFCELYVLAAIGTFFSTFTTSTLAVVCSTGLWLIGHAMDDARLALGRMTIPWIREGGLMLLKLLPDFTVMDLKAQLAHNAPVEVSQVFAVMIYAAVFFSFVVLGACVVFSRRDL